MEAMGLRPEDHEPPKHKKSRMATDDVVSEKDSKCDGLLLTRDSRSWSVSRSVCGSEAIPWISSFFSFDLGEIPGFRFGAHNTHCSAPATLRKL